MKIKITHENADKIESELSKVNGKSTTHTVVKFWQVQQIADRAESRLANVLKKDRPGCGAVYLSGVPTSASYGKKSWYANATAIGLDRTSSSWFLVEVARVERRTGLASSAEQLTIGLTKEAHNQILNHAMAGFELIDEPEPIA